MNSAEIRRKFLEFFQSKGHSIIASSSLVPGNDPTLLFTNSGMVQFKDVFVGKDRRAYSRATTSQRCVRAGGKHNDLENVGYTARHHTFFEMLGNFSFGDYFKRDAIHYAWELLTQVYRIPAERLWTTVYIDDDEAFDIWTQEIGVPRERCIRIGDKAGGPKYHSDNFWQMADTGPCGPCSEIFYDHGAEVWGGPPGSIEADGDRYIEVWNLVFMQFNRDEAGTLHPLPKPSVDTGMGLERIAAVLQQVHSNYDIDLFQDLIKAAARETHTPDLANNSLKVIADHIRACSFLIVDGVIPGSDGRGYVLRRIIRRAIRHGYKLGQKQPFFHRLVDDLCHAMGAAYPELPAAREQVIGVLRAEEERFAETIDNGMQILEAALPSGSLALDGETAFRLYDTYGFPLDLTADIARERGVQLDHDGFERAMERQREQARAASHFKMKGSVDYTGQPTAFQGYDTLELQAQGSGAVSRRQRRRSATGRRCRCRRTRQDTVLRRIRWTGGRLRRARGGQRVHRAVRGNRHAKDPGRRVRSPGRAEGRHAGRRRYGHGEGQRHVCASARPGIIRPPISCMQRCARFWGNTCSKRARWWTPIARVSIFPIRSR